MRKLHKISIVIAFFCIATIHSCDNSLNPIDRDTGIFAFYGFLDLNQETHYIRVRDLNAPFTKEATETLDAAVSLHNLSQGTLTLLESQIREYEGVFLHTFVYNNTVIPDNKYQIIIERSDGAAVDMSITTPTRPEPHAAPLNQNCHMPVEFVMEPMNGGTVVLWVGLGPGGPWGPRQVLKSDAGPLSGNVTFTFIPSEQVSFILPFNITERRCGRWLRDSNMYIHYIHYSTGFYEQIANDSFDILASTQRFGAFYSDTFAIPVDTTRVCPPDC